jgi:HEPN domain-containing protein
MYQELFRDFENIKNLAGKAWEHAVAIDLLNSSNIQDCSIHCFHYQQMLELCLKHVLETKTQFGSYSKSHKLNRLLEEVIFVTSFRTDKSKYRKDLIVITVCAEEYRYNFDMDCQGYIESVAVCDELIKELINFIKEPKLSL